MYNSILPDFFLLAIHLFTDIVIHINSNIILLKLLSELERDVQVSKEILHEWQSESLLHFNLKEKRLSSIGLVDVNIGANELNITLENESQYLEIIYKQIDLSIPVEY